MNILGSIQRWGNALYRLVDSSETAKTESVKEEKAGPADDDGPGAGGGYFDAVEIHPTSDGPGAGGGYLTATKEKSAVRGLDDGPGAGGGYFNATKEKAAANSNDGPGAGGGYKDGNADDDDDGPGAGGGYHTHTIDGLSMTTSTQATWPSDIFSVSGYLLTDAANQDSFSVSSESDPKKAVVTWSADGGAYFSDVKLELDPEVKPAKQAKTEDKKGKA